MKITDFHFNLKRRSLWGIQTPCHFRWWDIPGEICDVRNPDFRQMVFVSHGCCVFIDADALMHTPGYQQALGEIIQQALAIAALVSLNRLEYAFALILTKCDLLEPRLLGQRYLEEQLKPLTTHLDQVRTNYQTFRSNIPLVSTEAGSTLRVTGAATPLLWLVCELAKAHRVNLIPNPFQFVTHLLPSRLQPQPDPADGSLQRLFSLADEAPGVQKTPGLYLFSTARRNLLLLALAIAGLVGVIGFFSVKSEQVFQRQPNNLNALSQVEPKHLQLRLQLAQSYETAGQVARAEALYDEVLAERRNNLKALVGKATLCHARGDTKTAEVLFAQAETAAPTDLKAQVRAMARETLQAPAKPVAPTK